jgi:hypothetical protein
MFIVVPLKSRQAGRARRDALQRRNAARRHSVGERLAGRFVDAIDRSNRNDRQVAVNRLCFAGPTIRSHCEHRNQRQAEAVATDITVAGMPGCGRGIVRVTVVGVSCGSRHCGSAAAGWHAVRRIRDAGEGGREDHGQNE